MQRHQSAATPPLSPVISSIPLSTRRRSSLLSTSSGPHTPPPSRHQNLPILSTASSNRNSRNSTDSWNSSNFDGAEELQWEWRPEQTRLLLRVRMISLATRPAASNQRAFLIIVASNDPLANFFFPFFLDSDSGCSSRSLTDTFQRCRAPFQFARQDRAWSVSSQRPYRMASLYARDSRQDR